MSNTPQYKKVRANWVHYNGNYLTIYEGYSQPSEELCEEMLNLLGSNVGAAEIWSSNKYLLIIPPGKKEIYNNYILTKMEELKTAYESEKQKLLP
jgi:hypothetical protein